MSAVFVAPPPSFNIKQFKDNPLQCVALACCPAEAKRTKCGASHLIRIRFPSAHTHTYTQKLKHVLPETRARTRARTHTLQCTRTHAQTQVRRSRLLIHNTRPERETRRRNGGGWVAGRIRSVSPTKKRKKKNLSRGHRGARTSIPNRVSISDPWPLCESNKKKIYGAWEE